MRTLRNARPVLRARSRIPLPDSVEQVKEGRPSVSNGSATIEGTGSVSRTPLVERSAAAAESVQRQEAQFMKIDYFDLPYEVSDAGLAKITVKLEVKINGELLIQTFLAGCTEFWVKGFRLGMRRPAFKRNRGAVQGRCAVRYRYRSFFCRFY